VRSAGFSPKLAGLCITGPREEESIWKKSRSPQSIPDEIIARIHNADVIQISGPGEAKGELEKRIVHDGLKGQILAVESMDKMTDRQISAKVRQRFTA
jgi:hypothetical protein